MRPRKPPQQTPRYRKAKLDWKAYFIEFCRAHGEPVEFKGRLLFKDGWGYSLIDYAGPEYPPPTDFTELDILVASYYVVLQSKLSGMLKKLLVERDQLQAMVGAHSMPLQRTVWVQTEDEKVRKSAEPLDFKDLDQRIEWLYQDLEECEARLKELAEHGQAA